MLIQDSLPKIHLSQTLRLLKIFKAMCCEPGLVIGANVIFVLAFDG